MEVADGVLCLVSFEVGVDFVLVVVEVADDVRCLVDFDDAVDCIEGEGEGEGKSIDKQTDLSLEEEDKFNLLLSTLAFQQSISRQKSIRFE
jgi:hypothetical protein